MKKRPTINRRIISLLCNELGTSAYIPLKLRHCCLRYTTSKLSDFWLNFVLRGHQGKRVPIKMQWEWGRTKGSVARVSEGAKGQGGNTNTLYWMNDTSDDRRFLTGVGRSIGVGFLTSWWP